MGLEDGTEANTNNCMNVEFSFIDAVQDVLQLQDPPLLQGSDQQWTSYDSSSNLYKAEPVPENEWLQENHALPSSSYVTLENVGRQAIASESYNSNGSVYQWSSEYSNFLTDNSVSNQKHANETASTNIQPTVTPMCYNQVKQESPCIEIKPEASYIMPERTPVEFTSTQTPTGNMAGWPVNYYSTSNFHLESNTSMPIGNNNLDYILKTEPSPTDSSLNNRPLHPPNAAMEMCNNTGLPMQNNMVNYTGSNTYNSQAVQQPTYEAIAQKTQVAPAPREVKSSTCTICGKVLSHSFSLKRHMRIHTGERPYNCDICDQKFSTSDSMTRHKQRHLKNKSYNCDICYMPFINFADLRRHIQSANCGTSDSEETGETSKTYKCTECLKAYSTNHALQWHMRIHTSEKLFECEVCAKKFPQSSCLVSHKRIHTGEKPFKCDKCGMSYTSQNDYASHPCFRIHDKIFKCDMCDKTFHKESILTAHVYMHTGGKPFLCDLCGKAFCYSSNLETHKQWHSDEKSVCHICDKSFGKAYNLKLHMRVHTGEKPYECGVCGKKFRSSSHQTSHMKTHNWKEPFECDVCHKDFELKRQLTIHMYMHHGEKPYKCELCDKGFSQLFSLKRHRITIHERKRGASMRGRKRKNKKNVPYTNYGRTKIPTGARRNTRLARLEALRKAREEKEAAMKSDDESLIKKDRSEKDRSKKDESSDHISKLRAESSNGSVQGTSTDAAVDTGDHTDNPMDTADSSSPIQSQDISTSVANTDEKAESSGIKEHDSAETKEYISKSSESQVKVLENKNPSVGTDMKGDSCLHSTMNGLDASSGTNSLKPPFESDSHLTSTLSSQSSPEGK